MRADWSRWLEYLVGVLLGNAIYFLLLTPMLPALLRHEVFAIDLGLALDSFICAAVLLAIRWWRKG